MPIAEYYKGKGEKVMRDMKKRYGAEKGERIFYATANARGLTPGGRKGVVKSRPRGSGSFTDAEIKRGYKRYEVEPGQPPVRRIEDPGTA